MRIAALRIGPGVPRHGFVGLVAATHARAGLIALTNDRLVTLVPCETGGLPNGITADTPDGFAFERSLSVGARATRLERDGWVGRHGGDHDVYKHPAKPGRIIVPRHRTRSLGVARVIAKVAGWQA